MNSNWSYSPETLNLGQIQRFLESCDLEIWLITLKNNRAPLLSIIKLYASSSYVNSNWSYSPETVKLGVDLCDLDLWPWPFAWTSLLSLGITPENFMMIPWWEHGEKGVTDGQMDRRTDGLNQSYSCLVAAKNNRALLLSNIKPYVSFHHHMSIQTGVTVRKRLSWVVTLTFDLLHGHHFCHW